MASKYRSKWTEVDGIKFQSKKESKRYIELKTMEKFGLIKDLQLQVPYELNQGGSFSYKYKADFTYTDMRDGKQIQVVEDTKGYMTREFKKKMKLMKSVHGITIKLT